MGRRQRERRSRRPFVIAGIIAAIAFVWFGNDLLRKYESPAASVSVGKPSQGELIDGKRLPSQGINFEAYSRLGTALGRNCVHHDVRRAVHRAYDTMFDEMPQVELVYGETAWCWGGGWFWPHRTHQNGLSVDFMVPVLRDGEPAPFPASILNGFGYGIEFNADGVHEGYEIDWEAMARHLLALDEAAREFGLKIDRVIFTPDLRSKLFATKSGRKAKREIPFMEDAAWVRHDDHYHVDFSVVRPEEDDE